MIKEVQIIEIDPDCKYVFFVPQDATASQAREFLKSVQEWWASDQPFLVLFDHIKLQKIEKGGCKV